MPTWVTGILVPFIIASVTIAAQFYFKWVPNVEEQKRHVRMATSWLADILLVLASIWWLWRFTKHQGPVTPGFVVEVSLAGENLGFVVILVAANRFISGKTFRRFMDGIRGHLGLTERNIDHTGRLIEIAKVHSDALLILANDLQLSPNAAKALQEILGPYATSSSDANQSNAKKEIGAGL